MTEKGKLYIGTSGWVYSDWQGIFYPQTLPSKEKLSYFARHFKTAEVNYSFYHLPRAQTYQNWYSQTPADFLFALKASRFITHIKRLKGVNQAWKVFLENALNLKEKLGPILFQFPPSFKATQENLERLEKFLKFINSPIGKGSLKSSRFAFEFRDKSWFDEKIYKLLRKYKAAWVIADSSRYPRADIVTAPFIYIRMHGPGPMFASKYSKKELWQLAQKIKKWQKEPRDIYCYFNNDFQGYALENARELLKLAG